MSTPLLKTLFYTLAFQSYSMPCKVGQVVVVTTAMCKECVKLVTPIDLQSCNHFNLAEYRFKYILPYDQELHDFRVALYFQE